MDKYDLYYLVKENLFNEKFVQAPQLTEKLEELSPRVEKKVRMLLEFLLSVGIQYNKFGVVTSPVSEIPLQFNILEMVVYAIAADGRKPLGFDDFIKYLIRVGAPRDLLCKKVQKLMQKNEGTRKRKRQTVEKEEESQEEINYIE